MPARVRIPFILTLMAVILDGFLRWDALRSLRAPGMALFVASGVFVFLGWMLWIEFLKKIPSPWTWILTTLLCGLYCFVFIGAHRHVAYFGVMPNLYTFEYFFEETDDALVNAQAGLSWLLLLGTGVAAALVTLICLRARGAGPVWRSRGWGLALPLVALMFVFHNNVRLFPGATLPFVQTTFSISKAFENSIRGHSKTMRILSTGARPPVAPQEKKLPVNVLFILNESLRGASVSAFGYERPTSPRLDAFFVQHAQQVTLFRRAYAVATRTMLAIPSFVTGVSTVEPSSKLHSTPLLFDYAAAYPNVTTFFISAHNFEWANVQEFLKGSKIDRLWHKANGGVKPLHALGVDDKHVVAQFKDFLDAQKAEKFVGILHFRTTHVRYHARKQDYLWGKDRVIDRYDGSIRYQDHVHGSLFDLLEARGLLENTVIISTSDHGEAMGEHGYYGHLHSFYDEEARVPMWIYVPKDKNNWAEALRRYENEPVSNLDIVPTFFEMVGIDGEARMGRSLLQEPTDDYIFMQNNNDVNDRHMFGGLGVVKGDWKYLIRVEGPRVSEELFSLKADPDEQNNVLGEYPRLRTEFRDAVARHRNSRVVLEKFVLGR